jgi:hypothetical protein
VTMLDELLHHLVAEMAMDGEEGRACIEFFIKKSS